MDAVYLDHAATTPVREEVREAMEPFSGPAFGNPSSTHRWGRAARVALDEARETVARAIGARNEEVHFVRGGTESDNLAVFGGYRVLADQGPARVVVTSIEHSAVLEPAGRLGASDPDASVVVDVSPDGRLDLDEVARLADERPTLTSTMWVNNETGIALPVEDVVGVVHARGGICHSDACQALGKVPVRVDESHVDLLSATGHKIHGPKGTGFLFVRGGTVIEPLVFGGSQERGLRPGTEDVAGAVGLAAAVRLAVEEQERHAQHLTTLRDQLESGLAARIPGLRFNGSEGPRAPHVSSVGVPGIRDGAGLLMALDLEGVAVSGGSACHSGSAKASHVISALYGADDTFATVRFSFGRTTTAADVERALEVFPDVFGRLHDGGQAA